VIFAIRYDIRDGKIARGRESAARADAIVLESTRQLAGRKEVILP
jgi:hypothetical protein